MLVIVPRYTFMCPYMAKKMEDKKKYERMLWRNITHSNNQTV